MISDLDRSLWSRYFLNVANQRTINDLLLVVLLNGAVSLFFINVFII